MYNSRRISERIVIRGGNGKVLKVDQYGPMERKSILRLVEGVASI